MDLFGILVGRRLANEEGQARKITAFEGVPAMGLDGLGSSAYGPEAALTVLIPLGAVMRHHSAVLSGPAGAGLGIFPIYKKEGRRGPEFCCVFRRSRSGIIQAICRQNPPRRRCAFVRSSLVHEIVDRAVLSLKRCGSPFLFDRVKKRARQPFGHSG